jgi:hypothetical protein
MSQQIARHDAPAHTHQTLCCSVDRTECQIRRQNLEDNLWLEPDVGWFGRIRLNVVTLSGSELERMKLVVEIDEHLFRESGTDLASRLEVLRVGIVTREQEGAINVRPFPLAVIGTNHDEIARVTNTGEVVFLELERNNM